MQAATSVAKRWSMFQAVGTLKVNARSLVSLEPTVMLCVKSLGGVSHTKDEDTPIADLELSVRALDELARRTLAWAAERRA